MPRIALQVGRSRGACSVASLFSPQLKRLLTYVRPYSFRFTVGVILVAFVALAEGGVALMIRLAVDFVLNPGATSSRLPLGTIPWSGRVIYLNDYFPARIHHVWTVFAISLVILFFGKAIAEYIGTMEIQHCGLAAVTDLRNQVYARVIRQPIGFFQHHPTGRLISTAINDVERVRYALSEWLSDLFQKGFTFVVFVAVLLGINWRMALGCGLLLPLVAWPVNKFGRKIRRSAENSQTRLGDLSQILQETVSGNRVVKAFGMEDFEIRKFREAARRLLRENMRWDGDGAQEIHQRSGDGSPGRHRHPSFASLCARSNPPPAHDRRPVLRLPVCHVQCLHAHQANRLHLSAAPGCAGCEHAGVRLPGSAGGSQRTARRKNACALFA